MVNTRQRGFLKAADPAALSGARRRLFWLWNAAALLLSSAVIALLSLLLAYGVDSQISGAPVFHNYFRHPSLFLLNWLPIFLFQLLLYGLFGRLWLAYLGSALLFLCASIGHYYKMKFRYEPFVFSDIRLIAAGLGVAANYDLAPGKRVLLAALSIPAGALLLALLARGRPGRKARLGASLAVLAAVFPLWHFVYSSDALYNDSSVLDPNTLTTWKQQFSISKGFVYPFLYSIKAGLHRPENYSQAEAKALLAGYADEAIPADRRVNLMVFQLEAFSDLTRMGIEGISPDAYALYHQLERESYTGNLICNAYGGSTIDTERCFLSGSYYLSDYSSRSYTNVRYLRSQGYAAVGSHPYLSDFYSRKSVNATLGFEDYWFYDDHYEDVLFWEGFFLDPYLFPEVLSQFRDYTGRGENIFSFNVTVQGHSPYTTDAYEFDTVYWPGTDWSDTARYVLNNYLGSVVQTQQAIRDLVDGLRDDSAPAVLLLYGDHKPWLGDNASVLRELGVNIDPNTEEGFLNYYSTRYLLWANDAAKELLGDAFTGEGPDVSAGFLMDLVFDKLGWLGSAFNQFSDSIRQTLPVVTSNGYYYEDGKLTSALSPEGREAFRQLEEVTYYVNKSYAFPSGSDKK